jgi:hypothetical protein
LPDNDPEIMARLLLFLYTRQYPVFDQGHWHDLENEHYCAYRKQLAFVIGCNDGDVPKPSLHIEAAVYGLAEKYIVPEPKKLCRDAYRKTANRMFFTHAVDEHIASIRIIYNTTKPSDEMRDLVAWMMQCYRKAKPSFGAFQELIRSEADFASDIASKGMAKRWVWCVRCEKCVGLPIKSCVCGMMGVCHRSAVIGRNLRARSVKQRVNAKARCLQHRSGRARLTTLFTWHTSSLIDKLQGETKENTSLRKCLQRIE